MSANQKSDVERKLSRGEGLHENSDGEVKKFC